eukprot:m.188624 g.188624  ORF g.188624 m.188624 type:complete len:234 (+) comp10026_c0_seq4:1577-2278(+)
MNSVLSKWLTPDLTFEGLIHNLIHLERTSEQVEVDMRSAAVVTKNSEPPTSRKAPADRQRECSFQYGTKACRIFEEQDALSQQYTVDAWELVDPGTLKVVVRHKTFNKSRNLTARLPPDHPPLPAAESGPLSQAVIDAVCFSCSCKDDVSRGVPCRHIICVVSTSAIGLSHFKKYFATRWLLNTTIPSRRSVASRLVLTCARSCSHMARRQTMMVTMTALTARGGRGGRGRRR